MNEDWKVFNLTPSCTIEELKKSFRKLAFAHHPDLGGDSARFIEIKAAYDRVLRVLDPNSKQSAEKELEEFIQGSNMIRFIARFYARITSPNFRYFDDLRIEQKVLDVLYSQALDNQNLSLKCRVFDALKVL